MKRILAFILALAMCLSACYSLVACTGDDTGVTDQGGNTPDDGEKPDDGEHTHSFVEGKCECGATDPNYKPENPDDGGDDHEHSFVDGECACGAKDPTYKPENPDDGGDDHEHNFVDGECACGAKDPTYKPENPDDGGDDHEHRFVDGRCECGATDPTYKPDGGDIVVPEIPEFDFADVSLVISDMVVNDEYSSTKFEIAKLYLSSTEDGIVGFGDGKVQVTNREFNGTEYVTKVTNGEVYFILEDNILYANGKDETFDSTLKIDFESLFGFIGDSDISGTDAPVMSFMTIIEAVISGKYNEDVDALAALISEQLIPALGEMSDLELSEEDIAALSAFFESFAAEFIKVEAIEGGKRLYLDLSILKDWFTAFKTMKGSELVDAILGEGAFAKIKEALPAILAFTVEDLVYAIIENGGDLVKLEEAIDAIIAFSGAPEGVNVKYYLVNKFYFGGTLGEFLLTDNIKSISVEQLLTMVFSSVGGSGGTSESYVCFNCGIGGADCIIDDKYGTYHFCQDCYDEIFNTGDGFFNICENCFGRDADNTADMDGKTVYLCDECYEIYRGDVGGDNLCIFCKVNIGEIPLDEDVYACYECYEKMTNKAPCDMCGNKSDVTLKDENGEVLHNLCSACYEKLKEEATERKCDMCGEGRAEFDFMDESGKYYFICKDCYIDNGGIVNSTPLVSADKTDISIDFPTVNFPEDTECKICQSATTNVIIMGFTPFYVCENCVNEYQLYGGCARCAKGERHVEYEYEGNIFLVCENCAKELGIVGEGDDDVTEEPTLQDKLAQVFEMLEIATLPELFGYSSEMMDQIEASLNSAISFVKLEVTIGEDGVIKSFEYAVDPTGTVPHSTSISFKAEFTESGINTEVAVGTAGMDVLSGNIDIIFGAKGERDEEMFSKIKSDIYAAQSYLKIKDLPDMFNSAITYTCGTAPSVSEIYTNEKGKAIGVFFGVSLFSDDEASESAYYYVYYEDLFMIETITENGITSVTASFNAIVKHEHVWLDYATEEYKSDTKEAYTVIDLKFDFDAKTGELVGDPESWYKTYDNPPSDNETNEDYSDFEKVAGL